ncbi:MAG: sigma-70 family RNA polymerase sigma factor [Acidobacteriota bacterium]
MTDADPETEKHFVAYFSELLLIKLRRTLRSRQGIEDLRQETFVRVFHALKYKGLASPERLGAFVNGVCNNVLSEHYRARSRQSPLPDETVHLPGLQPNPEVACATKERKRLLFQHLAKLPAKDREVLRLLFFEDREKDDVCRICQVDRNHLRVLLHRAKNRLRDQLTETRPAANAAFV